MLEKIQWLGHSTVKILENKTIYVDPYNIKEDLHDADIIFITHKHFDHFSPEDIIKCMNNTTKIIVTEDVLQSTLQLGIEENNIKAVLPNNKYEIDTVSFETIPAYNISKHFHPRENNWVGYVISINNIKYYIAGDTDATEEARKVKCDIAFLPVGGTYTMDYREAATLANEIEPKVVVPIHYGSVVGSREDAVNFKEYVKDSIKCEILSCN